VNQRVLDRKHRVNTILGGLRMALFPRINATRLRTRANEWNKGVAIRKEPTHQRAEVKHNSLMRRIAITIGVYHGVDAEGVGGVNVAKDQKGVSDVA